MLRVYFHFIFCTTLHIHIPILHAFSSILLNFTDIYFVLSAKNCHIELQSNPHIFFQHPFRCLAQYFIKIRTVVYSLKIFELQQTLQGSVYVCVFSFSSAEQYSTWLERNTNQNTRVELCEHIKPRPHYRTKQWDRNSCNRIG